MSGLQHGWGGEDNGHADFVHGGVPIEDFNEEFKHVKAAKKSRPKKKRGCPENDYKAHVYVWITETRYHSKWGYYGLMEDRSRPYTVDLKVCCGCGKVYTRRYHW